MSTFLDVAPLILLVIIVLKAADQKHFALLSYQVTITVSFGGIVWGVTVTITAWVTVEYECGAMRQ